MLALFLQLAVPQGFMLARDGGRPTIAICTGHGPLLAPADDHGLPAKAPKPAPTCPFAGHGGTPTTAPLLTLTSVRFEQSAAALTLPITSVMPGRGLAAPPPPSQAPPALSI
jgi:hypothetical protein